MESDESFLKIHYKKTRKAFKANVIKSSYQLQVENVLFSCCCPYVCLRRWAPFNLKFVVLAIM